MIGLDVAERIVEIRDFAGGGLRSNFVTISQDIPVAKLVRRVSSMLHRSLGTFELLLTWEGNKVNLMKVRNDLMLADLGVDFTSDATFTLLIREWPLSSSETERLVELNDKETQESNEGGVDLSSPSKAMLLVEMTSESPTNDTETEAWTPTENNTMESIYPNGLKGLVDSNVDNVMNPTAAPEETAPSPSADVCNTDNSVLTFASDYTFFQHRNRNIDIGGRRGWDKNMSSKAYERRRALEDTEESEPTRTDENGYVGLVNQAMTCYLNSLIQALYMTPEFRNALYNWEYVYDSDKDEAKSIPYQLQKLFLNLQTSSKNAIETTSLTKSFGWDSTQAWQQHDIQELCRVMFDALEQKFKNTEQADLINRLYEGKMIDYVKCLECGTEKSREDTFLDIPLPVRPFGSTVAYNSVEEALGAFVQPETLDGTNQYHCETCNKKCDAHKGLKFTKFPYFLTLHLKRFDFDYNTFHRIKLNDEVTFPDVLNLNSFIPSATTEDSIPIEESSNANATKSQVAATTNSGTQENSETPPPCNNGISVNENPPRDNHRVNDRNDHDEEGDDEDEGIERNNEPSTSTCNSRNHDHLKNRDNAPGPKGPYMYELFSIMIHSGSASGGHYFAYIKDFRTGKWLCFNDQNVSTITYDDIQRTYGGGPARAYYSGVYSSSSNAYMLMYRQIDPARNALPMQVADFPKHLQELMKMQESEYNNSLQDGEYNDTKNRGILMRRYRHNVFCHHPVKKTTMGVKLMCFRNATVAEVTERAYKGMNLEGEVDRDQVRLVTYQENTGLVDCSFEGREHEPLSSMLNGRPDLFLEVRNKGEAFKPYLPRGFARHAYVVDFATNEVTKGPIIIYGHVTQTVQEYKEQLGLAIGMEPKDIKLVVQYLNDQPRLITSNESTLQDEGFVNASRIFVATASGPDSKKILENIYEIFFLISNLILLNVHLPDLSEDELRAQGIPTLEEKRLAESTPLTNGPPKLTSNPETTKETEKTENNETTTKPSETEEPSTLPNKTPSPAVQTETEDWHTPEQSNSEDSSLSYSDRTLVGEGDASEDDDYPLANVDHEIFSQSNQDNGQVKYPSPYLVRVMRDDQEPHKLIRVLCEKRMGLSALKKVLEPHVGVPAEYFKVYCQQDAEIECTRLPLETSQDDTASIWLKLGLALRNGEIQVSLFHLCTDSETEPFRFLCEWVVSKEATVGQAKKEILAHLKKKFHLDIPFERCRLRRKTYKTAANVYLDDKKVKDLKFYWREIIVQELPGKETVTNDMDVAIFARRMPRNGVGRAPLEELVVSGKSLSEIREKISAMSDIPDEHLEIAKGKSSLPDDVMPLIQHKLLEWHRQGSTDDDFETPCLDDGTVIYYRDSRELPQELIFTDKPEIDFRPSKFFGGASSSLSRSSRRGERALKIYLDDM